LVGTDANASAVDVRITFFDLENRQSALASIDKLDVKVVDGLFKVPLEVPRASAEKGSAPSKGMEFEVAVRVPAGGSDAFKPLGGRVTLPPKIYDIASDALRVDSRGYVGIGTDSPQAQLDVNGALQVGGPLRVNSRCDVEENLSVGGAALAQSIELRSPTPYIDFSTDPSADYNARIICMGNTLTFPQSMRLEGILTVPNGWSVLSDGRLHLSSTRDEYVFINPWHGYTSVGGQGFFVDSATMQVRNGNFEAHHDALIGGNARINGTLELGSNGKLRFGVPHENTDDIYFQRYVYGGDSSILELVLGDNPDGGPANDAFFIATRDLSGGSHNIRFQFNSNGDALKTGGGSWAALSDRRAKHDIQPLTGALDMVLSLAGKSYQYNDPKAPGAAEGECVGFIAQDVEQVFPEWVSELADGTKIISIRGFEALTVEALRDLRAEKDGQIAELKADNAALRDANSALEARVECLESIAAEVSSLKAALATLAEPH
jgi:hypothetical protein